MSAVIQTRRASGARGFALGWKQLLNSSEDAPGSNSSPLVQVWSSTYLSTFHPRWWEQAELNGWELRVRPGWQIMFHTFSFHTDASAPMNWGKKIWTWDRDLGGTRRTWPSTLFPGNIFCFMHKSPWTSHSFSWYDVQISLLCLGCMHKWNLVVMAYRVHEPSLPAPPSWPGGTLSKINRLKPC